MATATEGAKKPSGSASRKTNKSRNGKSPRMSTMTDEHKASLREGRDQSRIISRYLEALDQHKPKRGRKVTKESREKRLAEIDVELADAGALQRVLLLAERDHVKEWLDAAEGNVEADISALEDDFVKHAKAYSQRKSIPKSAWRSFGVPPKVLKRAGIK